MQYIERRPPGRLVRVLCCVSALLELGACAATSGVSKSQSIDFQEAAPPPSPVAEATPLLDRTQQKVYGVAKGTAQKFDSFFGAGVLEEQANVSRGLVAAGGQWDRRDGLEARLRLKARFALPALAERTRLTLGRGDAEDFIDGTGSENMDSLPDRFNDLEDEDWLIGVGYSRDQMLQRGWDFSLGVKLATPLEPYARATYRWNVPLGDAWLWRVRPRFFWQSQRGTGGSVTSLLDYAVSSSWLLRSFSIVGAEDEVEGIDWTQKLTAYQSLSDRVALSYGLYATGETQAEVPLRDAGMELRFRKRIAREWMFMEIVALVGWPREFAAERREINPGIGLEFEMQFGEWPGRAQRH